MRIFLMVLLVTFCFRPAFADSDLKSGYIQSCENHFRKSPAFCQCSYDVFTAPARNNKEKAAPINFEEQKQRLENEIKKDEDVLASDAALYPSRIGRICRFHNDIYTLNAQSGDNSVKLNMTDEQQKAFTLRMTNLKRKLHDTLERYAINSNSYTILNGGELCRARRMLKQLKKDQKNVPVKKHPSGLTYHMITKLSGGAYGHIDVVVVGEKAKCPK